MDTQKPIAAADLERASGVHRTTYRSWQARGLLSFAGNSPGPGVAQTFSPMAVYEAGFIHQLTASAGISVSAAAAVFRAATVDNQLHNAAKRLAKISGNHLPEFRGFEHRDLDEPAFLVFVAGGNKDTLAYGLRTWTVSGAASLGAIIAEIATHYPRVGWVGTPPQDTGEAEEQNDRRNARFPAVKDFHVINLTALLVEIDAHLSGVDPIKVWEEGR